MPNLASVINFFSSPAQNDVSMTLSGSIAPGATTVGVSNMSNYADGAVVVFTVDGDNASKQVFTGTKSGSNIVNAVWILGTNVSHSTGAAVIDYVSSGHVGMISKGLLTQHTQTGTHKGITTDTIATSGNATVGGTLGVTGAATLSGGTTLPAGDIGTADIAALAVTFAKLNASIFSGQVQTQANAGTAGGNMWWINLGGIKLLWGKTANGLAAGASNTYGVTLPTFFTTVQSGFCSVGGFGGDFGAKAGFTTSQPTTTTADIALISAGGDTAYAFYGLLGT